MTTSHNIDTSTSNKTAFDILRQDYKSILLVALIFTVGYIGSFEMAPDQADGFAGIFAMFGLAAVFHVSVLVTLIYCVVTVIRHRSRSWAVLLAAPILYIGLPILIGCNSGAYLMQLRRDRYQERMNALVSSMPHPVPTATAIANPAALLDYQRDGVFIPNLYRSSPQHRPIDGLSLKPNADFGNTFLGKTEFVRTVTNRYSGQEVTIEAIYTKDCGVRWMWSVTSGIGPTHFALLGISLMNGEALSNGYACVGLKMSAPLKIDKTYIGIELTQTGSPVELAELPQLVNVIEHARPN